MSKRSVPIKLILVIIAAGMVTTHIVSVRAQDPTIPTRTPTPDPNQPPTNPPPTTDPGDPGEPPPNTPVPGQTVTSEPAASATAGGIQATATTGGSAPGLPTSIGASTAGVAGSCDGSPHIRAIEDLAVHEGPGTDYQEIAKLAQDEFRPIFGRAAFTDWWQIQVATDLIGWVADIGVAEYGNTGIVPIATPPLVNGLVPTPAFLWNPTPLPLLTCVPTPTPTATTTGTPAPLSTPAIMPGAQEPGTEPAVNAPPDAVVEVAERGSAAEEVQAASVSVPEAQQTAAATGQGDSPTSVTNLIIPLLGLVLIAVGIVLALMTSRRGRDSSGPSE